MYIVPQKEGGNFMNMVITKIEAIPIIPKRIKVAAYARVSSGKEAMLNSLATQVSYYKRLIQSKHNWDLLVFMQIKQ